MTLPANFSKIFYKKGKSSDRDFFSRLGADRNSFKGLTILEIGCGYGSLSIELASLGAKKVIGIDINEEVVKYANENLTVNFTIFKKNVTFKCCTIEDFPLFEFDAIISKNTFEHVLGPESVLNEAKKRLKRNGKIFIGFGPLYNSPYGDHRWAKAIIPWGHLIFREAFLLKRLNMQSKIKINSISGLKDGLSKLSFREYKKLLESSGLKILYFKVNAGKGFIKKSCNLIRRIPFLKEFFSINIYCILEK